jgi:hypothetical protein
MKSSNRQRFGKGEELSIPEVSIDADDSIESMFRNEQQNNQNDVKELFHEDKIKARTDLSTRQIKLITKAYYLSKITGLREINELLHDFLTLSVSKDRKSRKEYVEGLKAKIDNGIQASANMMRGQFGK